MDLLAARDDYRLHFKREPESWRRFIGGLEAIDRHRAFLKLAAGDGARMAITNDDDWKGWRRDQSDAAGLT